MSKKENKAHDAYLQVYELCSVCSGMPETVDNCICDGLGTRQDEVKRLRKAEGHMSGCALRTKLLAGIAPMCTPCTCDRVHQKRLNRLVERLERRNVELSVQGYNWMVAHDKLKAGKSYDLPTTMDVPKLQAEVDGMRDECFKHREILRRIEAQVDKIRYACDDEIESSEVRVLLDMFEPDSGEFIVTF